METVHENLIPASVGLPLDGRPFVLRYRTLAFLTYASTYGRDIITDIAELSKVAASPTSRGADGTVTIGGTAATLVRLCEILWAGLVDAQPDLKPEDLYTLIGIADIDRGLTAAVMAMGLSAGPVRSTAADEPAGPTQPVSAATSLLVSGSDFGPGYVNGAPAEV
jgi:hypothetical protein